MPKADPKAPTIPARWLAKQLRVEIPFLAKLSSFIGRPDKQDNYAQTKAVEGGYDYQYHRIVEIEKQRDFMRQIEIAEMLGVSAMRVSQMTREGIFKQTVDGGYNRRETQHAIARWFRERLADSSADIGTLKRQKLENEVHLSKNLLSIQDRTYMRIEDLKKPIEHRILLTRQKLLRLGNKIAPRVPYLKSENEIEKAINDEVEEALRELARPVDYEAEFGQDEG